jgi:hypothetical protein
MDPDLEADMPSIYYIRGALLRTDSRLASNALAILGSGVAVGDLAG